MQILFNHDATALDVVEVSNWRPDRCILKALKRALVSRSSDSGLYRIYAGLMLEINGNKLLQLVLGGWWLCFDSPRSA